MALTASQQAIADDFMLGFTGPGTDYYDSRNPAIEVVNADTAAIQAQIDAVARERPVEEMVVLEPRVVTLPVTGRPADMYPVTLVPYIVENWYGSTVGMPGSITYIVPFIGTLLVYLGKEVIAQLAVSGVNELVQRAKKKFNIRGIKFRYLTGNVPSSSRGTRLKPRDGAGKVPQEGKVYDRGYDFPAWMYDEAL